MTANSVDQVKAQTLARFTEQGPGHINCAQAMVDFAMGILGRDQGIITVARYLGGGVTGMGGTCGAITGTAVALGLRDHHTATSDPELVPSTQAALKELIRAFEQEFGACTCRQLTGHDISTSGRHGGIPSERGPRSLPPLRRLDVRPPPPPARCRARGGARRRERAGRGCPGMSSPGRGYSIFVDTIADMTWPAVEAAGRENQPLLVPVAVVEQHGLHLPLATDVYGAHVLSSLVKAQLGGRGIPCQIAPPYYFGLNTTTSMFPGFAHGGARHHGDRSSPRSSRITPAGDSADSSSSTTTAMVSTTGPSSA